MLDMIVALVAIPLILAILFPRLFRVLFALATVAILWCIMKPLAIIVLVCLVITALSTIFPARRAEAQSQQWVSETRTSETKLWALTFCSDYADVCRIEPGRFYTKKQCDNAFRGMIGRRGGLDVECRGKRIDLWEE